LVAHNATFDHGFISYNAKKHLKNNMKNNRLCTRKLANRLLPNLPRKRLEDLCKLFNIKNEQAHRAMGDTKATVKIFKKFWTMMRLANIKTHEEILKFEKTPPSKIVLKTK
jgi:DNA polymerase III alpha subunit (gram-positive type)